ncbi:MAG: hypothetical protein COB51_04370 [Moraxellaceae bacterium]|nr:MAG: hypothetical protein COB51_04370 [Moraxellaceae bacterium]
MNLNRKKLYLASVSLLLGGFSSLQCGAQDLLTVLHQAQKHDSQWAATVHGYHANRELVTKSSAGIKPTLSLNAQVSQETYESATDTYESNNYESTRYGASLVQPLIRMEQWYDYKKGKALNRQIKADFKFSRQDFYMRVLTIYLDVLRTEENLRFRLAEKSAIKHQLDQTELRFKANLISNTDVQEAKAAFDISSVQYIIAQQDLDVALEVLNTLTGSNSTTVTPLEVEIPIEPPSPKNLKTWRELALNNNPQLRAARHGQEVAQKEYQAKLSAHLPTLDLVGSYQDSDRYVQTSEGELTSSSIAIKLEVPLYNGGSIGASRRNAKQLFKKAEDEFIFKQREILQDTNNLYRVVNTDVARVMAQKQSAHSVEAALNATQAGYKAGTRTIVDVLTAQQALFGVKRDYANARFDYIFDLLQLKQIAGILSEKDFVEVNGWLAKGE